MPPTASPITSGKCGTIAAKETVPLRLIIANVRVTRLIIRLSGTADFASNPIPWIRTGSRNSPPPSPIRPAKPPIGTHQPNALRKNGHASVRRIYTLLRNDQPTIRAPDRRSSRFSINSRGFCHLPARTYEDLGIFVDILQSLVLVAVSY